MKIFYILIHGAAYTSLCVSKVQKSVHFKWVHFIVCKSCLSKVDYKHFLWPGFSFILSRTPSLIHPALTALPLAVLVSMPQSPPGQSDSPTLAAEGQARAAVDI